MSEARVKAKRRRAREVWLCKKRGYWAECRIEEDRPVLFREVLRRPARRKKQ